MLSQPQRRPEISQSAHDLVTRKRRVYFAVVVIAIVAEVLPIVNAFWSNHPERWTYMITNSILTAVMLGIAGLLYKARSLAIIEGIAAVGISFQVLYWDMSQLVNTIFPIKELGEGAPTVLVATTLLVFWLPRHIAIPVVSSFLTLHLFLRWANLLAFPWGDIHNRLVTMDLVIVIIVVLSTLGASYSAAFQESNERSEELEDLANTDPLTGLPNRRALDAQVRSDLRMSLVLIDADDFKDVNDRHGHQYGDEVLLKIATALKESFSGYGVVGRWGGEEFLAILPNVEASTAATLAENARKAVASLPLREQVTVSMGIASTRSSRESATVFERCDQMMYMAKSAGKNRVQIEDPLAHPERPYRQALAEDGEQEPTRRQA